MTDGKDVPPPPEDPPPITGFEGYEIVGWYRSWIDRATADMIVLTLTHPRAGYLRYSIPMDTVQGWIDALDQARKAAPDPKPPGTAVH